MQSIDTAYRYIREGAMDLVLAGGAESLSHAPLVFNHNAVEWYARIFGARNIWARFIALLAVKPSFFKPVIGLERGLTDPITDLNMGGEAGIGKEEFDFLLDGSRTDFPLFAPPREPIALADYAAGLRAASLVPDGGTLQIGIGSLGDAVTQGLILRHRNNESFRNILSTLEPTTSREADVHVTPFASGLYGCSEMFVEGLLDLFRAGVLKREVDGGVLDSGFFVGSRAFYRALREMPYDTLAKFRMRPISFVNELYSGEREKRRARVGARFINDAMMATLLGDVISDGLDDGRIVSGVGGQYNFVAQAFALEGARSVIMGPALNSAVEQNIDLVAYGVDNFGKLVERTA